MLSAIILAAGESSRMERPKALLSWRGLPFIEHVCAALRKAGVEDRIVVLGRSSSEILAGWTSVGEKIALNPKPENGQLSSLRAGLAAVSQFSEAFMVCLADQPTVSAETYQKLIYFWQSNKDSVIIPRTFRTEDSRLKRGHPIIIPAAHKNLCFEGPLDKGLHWVTHHPSVKIADLEVADPEIIRDFDTPEDYAQLEPG
ncbi:MAG TPA: nucleotidyltransferase family protein [Elusimicrobiales bacterium]|nr:nucleotidyltransferase family protein [Elusimicrobiales bacterium]